MQLSKHSRPLAAPLYRYKAVRETTVALTGPALAQAFGRGALAVFRAAPRAVTES
jgi:hypothetical protein